MNTKFVRFTDWASERLSPDRTYSSENGLYPTRNRPNLSPVWSNIKASHGRGDSGDQPATKKLTRTEILDPKDTYLQQWNKAFVVCCILALSLDPLFFYIPVIDSKRNCLDLDKKLEIIVCVLRSIFDIFYVLHIIFQFRTGFIAPSSRVFGRGELVDNTLVIAKRYMYSYFIVDILSVLPVPQVVLLLITPKLKDSVSLVTNEILKYVVFIQYIPRFFRIYPLYKEVTRASGIFAERAWTGAAFSFVLYMLASHVSGASWYLFSIERKNKCWRKACKDQFHNYNDLYCSKTNTDNSYLNNFCVLGIKDDENVTSSGFNFGIYVDAFRSGVVETRDFHKKFFYCFWWGLRNLSSLGLNLKTSTYIGEIVFAIVGLLIFSLLIGNIQENVFTETVSFHGFHGIIFPGYSRENSIDKFQRNGFQGTVFHGNKRPIKQQKLTVSTETVSFHGFPAYQTQPKKYLQFTTMRAVEMRVKRRDAEQWMSHRMLPENLRERIRRHEQYKWQETRGVEEDRLVQTLPKDLRRDIKRHICLALLSRVPMFEKMDRNLLDALCDRLKPVWYTEKSHILREGDPVDEMLFIMRGNSVTITTNGGKTGFFNSLYLKAGDFCGEELLTWALDPNSLPYLPTSAATVQALTEVEAFSLMAEDLKSVASQFRRLHSKELKHTFKFYSLVWRTWAVRSIQAAWRRHRKRNLEKSFLEEERF